MYRRLKPPAIKSQPLKRLVRGSQLSLIGSLFVFRHPWVKTHGRRGAAPSPRCRALDKIRSRCSLAKFDDTITLCLAIDQNRVSGSLLLAVGFNPRKGRGIISCLAIDKNRASGSLLLAVGFNPRMGRK